MSKTRASEAYESQLHPRLLRDSHAHSRIAMVAPKVVGVPGLVTQPLKALGLKPDNQAQFVFLYGFSRFRLATRQLMKKSC